MKFVGKRGPICFQSFRRVVVDVVDAVVLLLWIVTASVLICIISDDKDLIVSYQREATCFKKPYSCKNRLTLLIRHSYSPELS